VPEVAVLPEIAMVIELFPRDRRLPALRDLTDPRSAATATLFNGKAGLRSINRGALSTRLVRYRPGLSATLHVSAASNAPDAPAQCFVKITSDNELAHEIEAAGKVNAVLERLGHTGLRLAQPVTWQRKDNVAVYMPAAGVALDRIIASGDLSPGTAQTVAAALADLHQLDVPALRGSYETIVEAKIARAGRMVAWARPGLAAQVDVLRENAARLMDFKLLGPTHRDMKPEHIIIDRPGNCVHLIDSGSLCVANPVIDVAALIVRLEQLSFMEALPNRPMRAFQNTLLDGNFDRVPPAWRDSLLPGMSYATLLLAIHLIQGLKGEWADRVDRIVDDAVRRVSGELRRTQH
jgi:hypothetical protein